MRSRWLVLGILFACRIGLGLEFQTVGSVADGLRSSFGFSHAEIGTLIGMFMLPGMVVALPSGYAGRFLPDRALVGLGLLALGAGGFVASAADGFGSLAAGRIACGVGFVLSNLYFTKMTADWFAGKELATAMAILVVSWPLGIAAGQLGYPWLIALYGWRAPFDVSAGYCIAAGAVVFLAYRAPARHAAHQAPASFGLSRSELTLTLIASLVWALFNAAYVVYLSFAPLVLVSNGYAPAGAAATISLASWALIFSAAVCGHIADRTRKPDLVLYACLLVGIATLSSLHDGDFAAVLSLAFGLIGLAPAGVIIALVGESMAPQRRAFGMGVFLTGYYVIVALAPAAAGWPYDRSGSAYWTILFAAALLGLAGLANFGFRAAQRALPALRPSP